jgi:ribonuclease J
MADARQHLANALNQPAGDDDHVAESGYLKAKIRDTLAPYFFERTKRRPMILPIVMEV